MTRSRLLRPFPLLGTALVAVPALLTPAPVHATVGPSTALPAASGPGVPVPAGRAVWPLLPRPRVVAGFDPPATRWGAGHRGVDLLGRPGQPVRAALAGTVVVATVLAGRGVVVVRHADGRRTTYEPVTAGVRVGDVVATGAVLGRLGLAGSHCFPRACLHWGLRRGEGYLDPLALLGLSPVRLLPSPGAGPVMSSPGTGLPTSWWVGAASAGSGPGVRQVVRLPQAF